ncbi:MAG: PAS domain S-box protein [Thermoleophilia bacterium]|nr:PAS domain S-box protein [Thermoleophilia bacterium]
MELSADAYLIYDQSGQITDADPRACETLCRAREDLIGRNIQEVGFQVIRPEMRVLWTRVLEGERFVFEAGRVSGDGSVVPVEITLSMLGLPGGQTYSATFRDLVHRGSRDEAFGQLIDTLNDAAFVIDFDSRFLDVNTRAVEVLGYSRAELLVMGPAGIDPYLSGGEISKLIEGMGRGDRQLFETQHRTKDGATIPVEISSSLVSYQGKAAILSIARDITDRRRSELMMQARLRLLELAPATTVKGFLEATLDELETLTDSLVGFCNFVESDGEVVTPQAWSTRTRREFCRTEQGVTLRVSEAGVWADAIRERRPIIHNDFEALPDRKGMPPGHAALTRELVVPVFRSARIVAVFAVGNKPRDYIQHDVEAVSSLADLAWDIAARKQVETRLLESEARSRRLLDASPDAIFLSDAKGRLVDCNQTALDRYGYTRAEIMETTAEDFAALDLRDQTAYWLAKALEAGTTFEWRQRRKDGSEFPVEIRAVPLSIGGEPGFLSLVRDTTHRKRTEEALRDSEERFRGLSSLSTEGIMIHQDGAIVDANRAFAQLMSCQDADDLVGRRALETLPLTPESLQRIEAHMQAHSNETYEIEIVRPDGSTLWGETSGREITYRGTRARLVSLRDITERKRAEAELRRSEEQLRQSQKMESVGRLAGGVAHDFNNMLGVILGHTELAMGQLDPQQPVHGNLQEIREAAKRSADIAQQLLAFARRQPATPTLLDLNKSVERTLDMLRRLIGEDVELVWLPGSDLGAVKMDPSQLDQVLMNLVANARDAITVAGKVTIETAAVSLDEGFCVEHEGCGPGDYVLLSVSDTGSGMEKETLGHLFEPFFTTKETGKGTGLGLATVYGIVKQNDGYIEVRSDLGLGTVARVYLPRQTEPAVEDERQAVVATPLGGGETLLVVEDEASVLRLTERVLQRLDYAVLSAQSPAEALRVAETHPGQIALLITDVIMPEMSGLDLAERLATIRPGLKTLYVSGYAADVISERGLLKTGVHFLQKPFEPRELAASVRAVLDQE